jgi:hypothetical protein
MKPRTERLKCPDKPGYVTITLDSGPRRGPHAFRLPTWSEATRLAEFSAARPTAIASNVEYLALLIGIGWHHEGQRLEAEYPIDDPSPAQLVRFGRAVERELEEHGYVAEEIGTLGRALLDACTARQRQRAAAADEAAKLADFSPPQPGTGSSP